MEKTLAQAKPYIPHSPSPLQREFLGLTALEGLFGGAAGGGKSDAALMGALQYVHEPDFAAAIFRRTKPDLLKPGAILDRAHKWLAGTGARWEGGSVHSFIFPSGARLHFGYGQNMKQLEQAYQGSEFQYVCIDELTQWPEAMYAYLFSRLRPLKAVRVPVRMRGTANPGGVGHAWVKRRFVENARHARGSLAIEDIKARRRGAAMPAPRIYSSPPTPETLALAKELGIPAEGSVFVPSFMNDNPGLDVAAYRLNLARLMPVQRAQLEHGDWDALAAGNFFKAENFRFIKQAPPGLTMIRSWDLAGTKPTANRDPDWTAGAKEGLEVLENKDRRLVIAHVEHFQEDPGDTERRVQAISKADGKRVPVLIEQEPGSAGKAVVNGFKTRVLVGHNVIGFPRTGPKQEYWRPVSSLGSAGGITLVEGHWNGALIDELVNLPIGHDDQADAISAGFDLLAGTGLAVLRLRALAGM